LGKRPGPADNRERDIGDREGTLSGRVDREDQRTGQQHQHGAQQDPPAFEPVDNLTGRKTEQHDRDKLDQPQQGERPGFVGPVEDLPGHGGEQGLHSQHRENVSDQKQSEFAVFQCTKRFVPALYGWRVGPLGTGFVRG